MHIGERVKGEQTMRHMAMEISRISWYFLERRTAASAVKSPIKESVLRKALKYLVPTCLPNSRLMFKN